MKHFGQLTESFLAPFHRKPIIPCCPFLHVPKKKTLSPTAVNKEMSSYNPDPKSFTREVFSTVPSENHSWSSCELK